METICWSSSNTFVSMNHSETRPWSSAEQRKQDDFQVAARRMKEEMMGRTGPGLSTSVTWAWEGRDISQISCTPTGLTWKQRAQLALQWSVLHWQWQPNREGYTNWELCRSFTGHGWLPESRTQSRVNQLAAGQTFPNEASRDVSGTG